MNKNSVEIIRNSLYLLFSAVIVFCVYNFCGHGTIISEDFFRAINTSPNLALYWKFCDGGAFIATAMTSFFCFYIPKIFHFHPNMVFFLEVAKSFFVTILIFLISKFPSLSSRDKNFGLIFYFLSFLVFGFFMLIVYSSINRNFFVNIGFFRNAFMLLFYCGFWLGYYKIFLNGKSFEKKHLVVMSIIGFVLGNSSELISFSTLFSLGLFLVVVFLWQIIRLKFNVKKFLLINFKRKRIATAKFFTPMIAFVAGFSALLCNPAFSAFLNDLGYKIDFSKIPLLYEAFSREYFSSLFGCLFGQISCGLIILLTIFCLFFKSNLKSILFAWILYVGGLIFFTLFIFTNLGENTDFELFNTFRFFDYMVISIVVIFILLGALIAVKKNKNFRDLTIVFCLLFLQFFSLHGLFTEIKLAFPYEFKHQTHKKDILKEYRRVTYVAEKMLIFYEQNSMPAYLYLPVDNDTSSVDLGHFKNYFQGIYGLEVSTPVELVSQKEAEKRFLQSGGVLDKKELETLDFNEFLKVKFPERNEEEE